MLLENRVALITGVGRGVGREIALCFAREGAAIVVNDVGADLGGTGADRGPADEVVNEIRAMGGQAVAVYDSVADFAAAGRITDAAFDVSAVSTSSLTMPASCGTARWSACRRRRSTPSSRCT
jgi:NAD(P)-dependent dehydrogenase (short-subunit alcohol dehydrogenase family)